MVIRILTMQKNNDKVKEILYKHLDILFDKLNSKNENIDKLEVELQRGKNQE